MAGGRGIGGLIGRIGRSVENPGAGGGLGDQVVGSVEGGGVGGGSRFPGVGLGWGRGSGGWNLNRQGACGVELDSPLGDGDGME